MIYKILIFLLSFSILNYTIVIADNTNNSSLSSTSSSTTAATTSTTTTKKVIPSIIPPTKVPDNTTDKCVCDGGLLPRLGENGKELEICQHCKCKYENRNTTLIKVVVIIVIWIISILVIYMLFLMCLDPLLNKRVKANYQEHTNEDDDTTSVHHPSTSSAAQEMNSRSSANVLNRVGHQQDKWKRQVREQRKNIYDRRTMLN